MLVVYMPTPTGQVGKDPSRPTPTQTQLTWATILLFLAAFWYGVGVGINALWGSFVG